MNKTHHQQQQKAVLRRCGGSLQTFALTLVIAVASQLLFIEFASACSLSKKYLEMSLEEHVSSEPLIFIGHVVNVIADTPFSGTAEFDVEEMLRGPKLGRVTVPWLNSDCTAYFILGKRYFYGGSRYSFILRGEPDGILLALVTKLRRGEPLKSPPQ